MTQTSLFICLFQFWSPKISSSISKVSFTCILWYKLIFNGKNWSFKVRKSFKTKQKKNHNKEFYPEIAGLWTVTNVHSSVKIFA